MRWLLAAVVGVSAVTQAAEVFGESERTMIVEAKLGPFMPLIDRGFTNRPGPYQSTFGSTGMLLGEVEVDYEFFQKFGTLSGGISGGYTEKFGKAIVEATGEQAAQSTGLRLVPLKALISYRFDYLSAQYSIPLVPYVKAAFVVMPWWVTNGGTVEVADGLTGTGVKFGIAGTVGLSLDLNFLDPRLARDFDTTMGVNHTYLFAEFTLQEMTLGAQSTTSLDFSSRHFTFGLALEF